MLDQNEFNTALVARFWWFHKCACVSVICAKLLFEDNVGFEKRLVLLKGVVDVPSRNFEELVLE